MQNFRNSDEMNYKEEVNSRFTEACYRILKAKKVENKARLAEGLGISSNKLSEILSGRMKAGMSEIQKLCNTFNIPFEYIFNGRDKKNSEDFDHPTLHPKSFEIGSDEEESRRVKEGPLLCLGDDSFSDYTNQKNNQAIGRIDRKQQLHELIEYYSKGNQADFARRLGITPQGVSTWLKRESLDIELVYAKCQGLSAEWLLTGEGEMLKNEQSKDFDSPKFTAQNDSPKQDFDSPKRQPKSSEIGSDEEASRRMREVGASRLEARNSFSGYTDQEINEVLAQRFKQYLLSMYERGKAYPALVVERMIAERDRKILEGERKIWELTQQVRRLQSGDRQEQAEKGLQDHKKE